ncbi:heat shock 70 kDa protein 12A-like [Sardina pilchardus]|uniref:heat shock 70 kDa protein 12A-like n=1 Tax=Sardina pilchardus TaxID=27697 RepID=UPI002E14AE80
MADSTFWIIAIDFGTAYSGYCYCVRSKPDAIRCPVWGEEHGQSTLKTPTCILFDEQGNFRHFGYDALMTYKMNPQSKDSFFQNFKMDLYNKTISRHMVITASNQMPMSAMKVFSESLRYLKGHALEMVAHHTSGKKFIASDVTWVLTVPAIWDPAAKQFMREAATKAGLVTETNSSHLIISLEPEAASAWCKQLPSKGFIAEGLQDTLEQKPGTQYIVVDCGGGTVDIAVHKVLEGGFLKEIHKASGGDVGGSNVDNKFKSFLRDIFNYTLWDQYEADYPSELQKMMFDFTRYKCVKNNRDVFIPCPYSLSKLAEETKAMHEYFKDVEGVSWSEGSFKVTYSKLKTFYKDSLKQITKLIKEIFATPEININILFLVGGYASSEILQEKIKRQFSQRCKIVCPVDAHLAVAKGAVRIGENPRIISSRVSALTYGISEARTFDPSVHKEEKRRENNAKDYVYCTDLFHRFIQKDEAVHYDDEREYEFSPINVDQISMTFRIFSTEAPDATYIDDPGMKEIGSFSVSMPDISAGRNRRVKFQMRFGLTELQAKATDLTSKETNKVHLDFLTK